MNDIITFLQGARMHLIIPVAQTLIAYRNFDDDNLVNLVVYQHLNHIPHPKSLADVL